MKPLALLVPACVALAGLPAAETTPPPQTVTEAIAAGRLSVHARLRQESVRQGGLRGADALTLRLRIGFTTARLRGWQALAEAEHIEAAAGDHYNQAGLNPGGAGRAVVADPEGGELNQAWLAWSDDASTVRLGRQRLVLDDARFLGDVGWRQNMQTYDGVTLVRSLPAKAALTYAYLARIHRVFGDRHPQGDWDSDSHVFHYARPGLPAATTFSAHASLLDFASAPAQSCATLGASVQGAAPLTAQAKLTWRAGAAWQRDHGSSPLDYSAHFLSTEAGLAFKSVQLGMAVEELGSDGRQAFRTPLATLHAFNGWADQFLTTPAAGLRDAHVKLSGDVAGCAFAVRFHRFATARGSARLGEEWDAQVSRKFGSRVMVLAKVADFRRRSDVLPNVTKFWLQLDYTL